MAVIDMKAFMQEENKGDKEITFAGIERYKDKDGNVIPFILKRLNRKEIDKIRSLYEEETIVRDDETDRPLVDDGQAVVRKKYDSQRAGLHLMVEAFVQPKLDDKALMEYYGVYDRLEMPYIIFSEPGEMKYANECMKVALGIKKKSDEMETLETVKN